MINYTRDWNRRVVKNTEVNELHEDEEVRICSTDYSFCGINATTRKLHVALSKIKCAYKSLSGTIFTRRSQPMKLGPQCHYVIAMRRFNFMRE